MNLLQFLSNLVWAFDIIATLSAAAILAELNTPKKQFKIGKIIKIPENYYYNA